MSPPPRLAELTRFALLEDNLAAEPRAALLHGACEYLRCEWPHDPRSSLERIERWQAEGWYVAFAGHFELGYALEPRLQTRLVNGQCLLEAWAFAERTELSGAALAQWWAEQLATLTPQAAEAGLLMLKPGVDQSTHEQRIQQVLDYIDAGDCYQVNLTFAWHGQAFGSPIALFSRLRDAQPVEYGALIRDADHWILSRSPELFVARRGDRLACKPMKGTAPRHDDVVRDAANAAALAASDKNRAENLMIVDLIRNDLGRLAPAGGVHVARLFELERYATVYQLTSTILAEPVDRSLSEVLRALFPCGSVTGAPKIRAEEILNDLESGPRGIYCGALGELLPGGDFALNVPIRTLTLKGDACRLDTGGGIVADSVPADEFAECIDKARFTHVLTEGIGLIETMRYDATTRSIPLLERHLARLTASAHALHFVLDTDALRDRVGELCGTLTVDSRVRLQLARNGSATFTHAPLDALTGPQTVSLAPFALNAADARLRHKTTARVFYDRALRDAMSAGHFDVLFFNAADELCEGARSNVVVDIDGHLYTPPLKCGLLPGVMRAKLLDDGVVQERTLSRAALFDANRVWVVNALRGMVPVVVAGRD
ncbi:aminodeoxychorismate synthase component I [Uliginosibacterium sp. sgz301328]|uniref:aminodeoxychorismate synthase component I n=1 Tax=Uliginosibacterium sp. sgz301328 TaxID=3243764 RepID=UPI00359EA325